jgi:glycosyltransferase involved in cell wall biosynthesis
LILGSQQKESLCENSAMSLLPLVSVLIPAYNESRYIIAALSALVGQSYPCFEVIVIDNRSTDNTAVLVEQFICSNKDLGIPMQLLYQPEPGTNHAREMGRLAASGQIIAQLDADCVPDRGWLYRGVKALQQKGRVAVTGPYDYFDCKPLLRHFSLISQQLLYPMVSFGVQQSRRGAILIGGNTLVWANTLDEVGGYDTRLTFYGDDVELGMRLSRKGFVQYKANWVMPSSARRYAAGGFWEVNKKYQACFWNLIKGKSVVSATIEMVHPR